MKLPSASIRASLRLANPAQRYAWAVESLYAALTPSPAVVADLTFGIPAKPITRGLVATSIIGSVTTNRTDVLNYPNFLQSRIYLPFNLVQNKRGVPLIFCVTELSTEVYQSYVGTVTPGEPIPDNSIMKTFEQYLVEQLSIIIATTPNIDLSLTSLAPEVLNWYYTDHLASPLSVLVAKVALQRTGMVGGDRYGDITGAYAT